MLDRVSTSVLGLDGQGGAQIFADYWQWERAQTAPKQSKAEKSAAAAKGAPAAKKKLSYMEAREWEQMERRILEAEQSLESIRIEMHSPDVVSDGSRLQACYQRLQATESEIATLYSRWAELEEKQQQSQ